jgi:hypothetical protein
MSERKPAAWRRWSALASLLALWSVIAAALLVVTEPFASGAPSCPEGEADPARLEATVRSLSELHPGRGRDHPEQLDRVARDLERALEQAGGRVSEQPFTLGPQTFRNVSAIFGPETKERLVVGAHYDAAESLPGADDNASGVAALLELARLLGEHPPSLEVELVAYTLEEPPTFGTDDMGSAVHAASLRKSNVPVRAMFSLEMLGDYLDSSDSQQAPFPPMKWLYPSKGNFVLVVGTFADIALTRRVKAAMSSASSLPIRSTNAPRLVPGIDFSDHANYWDQGYPAVMLTDTAFYRNDRYHTARDTADTLDYRRLAQATRGVYCAVHALSSSP